MGGLGHQPPNPSPIMEHRGLQGPVKAKPAVGGTSGFFLTFYKHTWSFWTPVLRAPWMSNDILAKSSASFPPLTQEERLQVREVD